MRKYNFNKIYNKIIILLASDKNGRVDPKQLEDKRVKKLLSYGVDCSGLKDKDVTSNIDETNLSINGLQYISIYENIRELELFNKIYPGVDKTSCKLWSVSNSSEYIKEFQENEESPKWLRMIGKTINKVVKFEELFDDALTLNVNNVLDTESSGYSEKSKGKSKDDLSTVLIDDSLIIFYVDDSGTILKAKNISDENYKKLCLILANIAIAILSIKGANSQNLKELKTEGGKTLAQIGKSLVKEKVAPKSKAKEALQKAFKLYKTTCKESFSRFSIHVLNKSWGKDILKKVIQVGNKQVKEGKADISFPDIGFIFGHTVTTASKSLTKTSTSGL